jgi:hypothetical protein
MIIAGDEDRHTLSYESKELFARAPESKLLWIVRGAKHQNLHRYTTRKYERNVLEFFAKYLNTNATQLH